MFPQQWGPCGNRCPFLGPYLAYPPGSPHRLPIERDAPFPEPSFNYFSEFLVNTLPPCNPTGPLWTDVPISRAF